MSAVVVAEGLSAAPLDELAARIDEAHAGVERSFKAGVEHALRAGTLLLEAKARVPHGKWGAWLRDNVRCSARTARAYMQIAGLDDEKRQRVADLPLRQAVKAIGKKDYLTVEERQAESRTKYVAWRQEEESSREWTMAPIAPPVAESQPVGAADDLVHQLDEAQQESGLSDEDMRAAFVKRYGDAPVIDVAPADEGTAMSRLRQRAVAEGYDLDDDGWADALKDATDRLLGIADEAGFLDDPVFAAIARQFDVELDPFPGLTYGQLQAAITQKKLSRTKVKEAARGIAGMPSFLQDIAQRGDAPITRWRKIHYRPLIERLLQDG